MPMWVRMLAVMLVLSTGGAFQAAAAAYESVADCADEEETCDCSTCVVTCLCCRARASILPQAGVVPPSTAALGPVVVKLDEPVATLGAADIFHPPKA